MLTGAIDNYMLLRVVMRKHGIGRDEALGRIRKVRSKVEPNEGFRVQLARYERVLVDGDGNG